MRIALGIEYNGSGFRGWETQRVGRTVQDCVEAAVSKVADHPLRVVCAGRTDAGVHATGQVVHFDSESQRSTRGWVMGANSNLPADVCVRWAVDAGPEFHARFRARARHYRYVLLNRPIRPSLEHGRVAWEYRPLDVERMQAAAGHLVGEHDFSSFRGAGCQSKSPVREIQRLSIRRRGEVVTIDVSANAFLMHMVRNLAGVLIAVGCGVRPPSWAEEVLEARDRRRGSVTAPPGGLYLVRVDYPAPWSFPAVSPPWGVW